jgi:hypothetical protein
MMRTYFEHAQGGGWIRGQFISFKGDTLQVIKQNIRCIYLPLMIPDSLSNYKPDW